MGSDRAPSPCGCLAWAPVLLLAGALGAEPPGLRYSASRGSVTLGEQQVYRLCFRPDVAVGRWGVALDLEMFIDNRGRISARGWDLGTPTQAVDTVLRKIYYVRYGQPRDPVYVKVGALDRVTLGYGLIMAGYRNTRQYPAVRNTGLLSARRADLRLERRKIMTIETVFSF